MQRSPYQFHGNGIMSVPYADQTLKPGEHVSDGRAAPMPPPRNPYGDGYRFARVGLGGGAEQGAGAGAMAGVATSVSQMTFMGQQQYYAMATPDNTYGLMGGSGTGYDAARHCSASPAYCTVCIRYVSQMVATVLRHVPRGR